MKVTVETILNREPTGIARLRKDVSRLRISLIRSLEAAKGSLRDVLFDREKRPEYPKRDLTRVDGLLEELRRSRKVDPRKFPPP